MYQLNEQETRFNTHIHPPHAHNFECDDKRERLAKIKVNINMESRITEHTTDTAGFLFLFLFFLTQ